MNKKRRTKPKLMAENYWNHGVRPFFDGPCDECKAFGKCKLNNRVEYKIWNGDYSLEDFVRSLVPYSANDTRGAFIREHMQAAYDAFHDQDYETAGLHFMTIINERPKEPIVFLGLASIKYFLKDYAEAIEYAKQYAAHRMFGSNRVRFFIKCCEIALKEKTVNVAEDENKELLVSLR